MVTTALVVVVVVVVVLCVRVAHNGGADCHLLAVMVFQALYTCCTHMSHLSLMMASEADIIPFSARKLRLRKVNSYR
jgi:hypothetical protein